MTRSSPARRPPLTSPERRFVSSFLGENRNNELSHRDALIAAQIEHERVREAAIRVYELHELKEEHRRIAEQGRKEEERLKAEALVVAEEKRLRELKAKTIPRPPPEPEPQPPKPVPVASPAKTEAAPTVNGTTPKRESKDVQESTTPPTEKKPAPAPSNPFASQTKPAPSNPFATTTQSKPSPFSTPATATQTQPAASSNPFAQPNGTVASQTAVVAKPAQPQPAAAPVQTVDRYSHIHQELKKLRKELQAQAKVAGSPLKGKMGIFRREIRVSIGQLTAGKGANAQPVSPSFTNNETILTLYRPTRSLRR
jgi:nucleoporin GLE1